MKKLISTAYGRIGLLIAVVVLFFGIKDLLDRIVPFQILHAVESGRLREYSDGTLPLPWYWQFEVATGVAYVTRQDHHIYVVLPQSADGETRFSGLLATDDTINLANTPSLTLNIAKVAEMPSQGADASNVTIDGEVEQGLYSVENNAD